MQTFIKSNNSPKFHDAVKAGGASNKAVNNILRAGVHPKLKIGAVNDPAEVEADRVADQVMRMPSSISDAPSVSRGNGREIVNRKCEACGDEKTIRRQESGGPNIGATISRSSGTLANETASQVVQKLGNGVPLPSSERAFFEPRFGTDLSHVRIHTNSNAQIASKSINAKAFSLGDNIAFANGEYQPGTIQGRSLLAHEITHTLQAGDTIRRTVRKCCRNVESGVGVLDFMSEALGMQHCWLRTDSEAAGMGPEDDGPLPANPLGIPTMITDHTDEVGTCTTVSNTDEECVNERLTIGQRTGRWGLFNNCNTFVHQTLRACSTLRLEPRYMGEGLYLNEDGTMSLGPGPKF